MDISKLIDIKRDYKSAISASALFWALSSFLVILLKPFKVFDTYMDALPFVILVSWIAGEIAERIPKQHSIAYCEECGWKVMPNYPFKKLWSRWLSNNCVTCGKKLSIVCGNNHLLKFFTIDELPKNKVGKVHCSQCGRESCDHTFTLEEFSQSIENLVNASIENDALLGDLKKHVSHRSNRSEIEEQLHLLNLLKKLSKKTIFGSSLKYSFDYIERKINDSHEIITLGSYSNFSLQKKMNRLKNHLKSLKKFASSRLEIPEEEIIEKSVNYVLDGCPEED